MMCCCAAADCYRTLPQSIHFRFQVHFEGMEMVASTLLFPVSLTSCLPPSPTVPYPALL